MKSLRILTIVFVFLSGSITYSFGQSFGAWKIAEVPLKTIWADSVTAGHVHEEYPRPQMVRNSKWCSLNGLWQMAISDTSKNWVTDYDRQILVPFPVESALSGVKEKLLPNQFLWYRRKFPQSFGKKDKILLHFGAVDYKAWVYVNGTEVGVHEGGYTSFSFEISKYLKSGENEIVVKVYDPTDMGYGPHGKQVLEPANIYYTASSGIWQSVWIESVPDHYIKNYTVVSDVDNNVISCKVTGSENYAIEVIIKDGNKAVAKGIGRSNQPISIVLGNAKLWSPDSPFLYDLNIRLLKDRKVVDSVLGYFGFRKISVAKDTKGMDRIFLNNKYLFNHGVLDQGFWPDGLYTAPTASALEFDIKAIKQMGFNTVRKHIKVEPELWYYYADRYGLLVWQDMVNPNQGLREGAKEAFEKQSVEIINQLFNHPSIVLWVVFNERWGQFDQKRICDLVRSRDQTRIINGHSGEYLYVDGNLRDISREPYIGSDVTDVHSYPYPRLSMKFNGKPMVCGEFGGTGVPVTGHEWDDLKGWGYTRTSIRDLKRKYSDMIDTIKKLETEGLSGSIYTEPFDVEGEENGLMTYDRRFIKIDPKELRAINTPLSGMINPSEPYPSLFTSVTHDVDYEKNKFDVLTQLYSNGRRDSAILRQLALLEVRNNDTIKVRTLTKEYISAVKNIFSEGNIRFLQFVTKSVYDPGFTIFINNVAKVDAVMGGNYAEWHVRGWISKSEIKPVIDAGRSEELETLIPSILNKYGMLGAEKLYGVLMMSFLEKQNWLKFGKYYSLYYQTAVTRSEYHINNISWTVVEHVDDPLVLQTALVAMKYNIEKFSKSSPNDADTYAAILFKMGMKNDAVQWAEKAVSLSNNDETFVTNRNKIRSGQKTW